MSIRGNIGTKIANRGYFFRNQYPGKPRIAKHGYFFWNQEYPSCLKTWGTHTIRCHGESTDTLTHARSKTHAVKSVLCSGLSVWADVELVVGVRPSGDSNGNGSDDDSGYRLICEGDKSYDGKAKPTTTTKKTGTTPNLKMTTKLYVPDNKVIDNKVVDNKVIDKKVVDDKVIDGNPF
eukprot:jgi/Psemu1/20869/gm1.20869_g